MSAETTSSAGGTLLVADDEESIRWVLERSLGQRGHRVIGVGTGSAALDTLRTSDVDVALVDIRMPDVSGLDLLTRAKDEGIDTLLIVMTAQNTMANAIEATKRGAYDYLTKPFDLEEVGLLVDRALALRRLTRDLQRLRGELEQRHELVIGRTPAMQEVYKIIGRVAATDATVLIQGDTGTGKELVAAIRVVARGDSLLAPAVTRRVVEAFAALPQPAQPSSPPDLSARELEVLRQLARGRSNAEIATAFVVSEATVKTHVSNVLAKLGLRDRIQAVIYAYEHGFVRPGEADG